MQSFFFVFKFFAGSFSFEFGGVHRLSSVMSFPVRLLLLFLAMGMLTPGSVAETLSARLCTLSDVVCDTSGAITGGTRTEV